MADHVNIKRPPRAAFALHDAMPDEAECYDHCVTLNDDDLKKFEKDGRPLEMPAKGDLVHVSVMGRVVGYGDDHGHRYVRIEIEDILFLENETTEETGDKA